MSYLLDTNVVSELRKGRRANAGVRRWFEEVLAEELWLSVLVIGELRQGAARVRRRDAVTARRLDQWIKRLVGDFEERILPVDREIAELWGELNVPDPRPAIDGLLAATALVNDLTLVTRNGADVAGTGARVLDPFGQGRRRGSRARATSDDDAVPAAEPPLRLERRDRPGGQ